MRFIFRPPRAFFKRRQFLKPSAQTVQIGDFTIAATAAAAFVGVAIISGVFSSAGAATSAETGESTASSAFASAGTGSAAFVGAGIISGAMSSAGAGSADLGGAAYSTATLSVSGVATASFVTELLQIVSTNMIQKPVDYVMAQDADKYGKGRISGRLLQHVFGEKG